MSDRWERVGAATGIVTAVLFVVGLFLFDPGEFPAVTAPAGEIAGFFTDNRTVIGAQGLILAWGFLALLWFSGSVRRALLAAEGPPGRLSSIAFGAGVVASGLLVLGAVSFVGLLGMDMEAADDATLRAVAVASEAGFVPILAGFLALALFVAASSLAAVRFGGLPRWLGWAGLVVFVAAFVGSFAMLDPHEDQPLGFVLWISFLLNLLWILVASITLTINPVRNLPASQPDPSLAR